MKRFQDFKKGHTKKYDLSVSKKLIEEAIKKINLAKEEISKMQDADLTDLEEGWNLIDKYYGNIVRGEIFKRRGENYIPNTSAIVPKKGDS